MTRWLASLIVALAVLGTADIEAQWWRWGRPKTLPVGGGGSGCDAANVAAGASNCPLLTMNQVLGDREGVFLLPTGSHGGVTFGFSYDMALNRDTGNSVFVLKNGKIAEVNIPTIVDSGVIGNLNRGTIAKNFVDAYDNVTPCAAIGNGCIAGGMVVHNSRIIMAQRAAYDANNEQREHLFSISTNFISNIDLKLADEFYPNDRSGAIPDPAGGFVAGYLGHVPTEWQAALGGPLFSGWGAWKVMSRNSYGPAIGTFDPSVIGSGGTEPYQWNWLLGYPASSGGVNRKTLGRWDVSVETEWLPTCPFSCPLDPVGTDPYDSVPDTQMFGQATELYGAAMIDGTRTLAVIQRRGETSCYGAGTTTLALHGTPFGSFYYCYDPPFSADEGTHGYPYHFQMLLYDLLDLKAVKAGTKQPWEVVPYAYADIDSYFPVTQGQSAGKLGGLSFDKNNRRLYIGQRFCDALNDDALCVNVFNIP